MNWGKRLLGLDIQPSLLTEGLHKPATLASSAPFSNQASIFFTWSNIMRKMVNPVSQYFVLGIVTLLGHSAIAKDQLPQVSADGLKLVKQDEYAAVYLQDGADFSNFNKVAILDCTVEFRKNWQRDQNEDIPFSVKDKDVTRIKGALAEEFKKVFSEELIAKGETVVAESGADVLILRPAIINLDISVPDAIQRVDEVTLTASAGQMTLYMEIYNSTNNEILARVIDPEESRDFGDFVIRNEVTNLADADLILKQWADRLADFLAKARNVAVTAAL